MQSPEAMRYLVKRGLESGEIVDRFRLGYANRTLCLHLPASNRAAGDAQRTRLKQLGILRNQKPGHEHFNGSLVIPVFNLAGEVVEMYGRKIVPNLRPGTDYHTYLPGPHRGVWNEEALAASKEIILCEALVDALTFWVAGYRQVTASYGTNGFTEDHRRAFERHGTERVYIAYDRDEAGDKAADKLAAELMERGIECFRVQFPKGMEWRYHGDSFDMESAQRRAAFIKQAAYELAVKEEAMHADVGKLWAVLQDQQRERIKKALTQPEEKPEMTNEEQTAAMELLGDPRLLDRVLEDFERCGAVGEEINKKVSYLAAVSRLLPKPLAVVVQSSSSAGKSSLMEAVLDFIPEEHRESYTAMTSQALFYMGQKNLKHKILAIAEQQGADAASYPLKLLQSEGKLNIASTGKDPVSGKHVTHEYEVEGPVMIFLTTTAPDVDEELMNRCLVLAVNEDREQTRAIHQKQREAQTLEGLRARTRRNKIVRLHRNAQRLLRPIPVVIEHLKDHSFPDAMTRTRRDHMKFLTLIQAVALLHQHQREIKSSTEEGETFEYIEATEADVKLAWELANHVLIRSLDDVQTQTRRLLLLIDKMVTSECQRLEIERLDYRFTRATVRQFSGWSDSQLKTHLHRLEELEYVALHRGAPGQSFVYALNFEMDESGRPVLPGLSYGAKSVRMEPERSGFSEGVSGFEGQRSGSSLGQVQGVSGGGVSEQSPVSMRTGEAFAPNNGKHRSGADAARIVATDAVVALPKPNGVVREGVR